MHRQKFLNYNEAKDYLKNLDIKTQRAYKKWQKENRIKFLPNWANGYYKEWISWNDYLNKKSFAEQILNYNDAKNFVKINLLEKTQRGYIKWQNSNKINFLPSNPSKFYKEWITWADFVSSNTLSNKEISSKLLKYDEAKVLLYKFNMKSSSEYINWFKNINNNVIKVPYSPDVKYKNWISWADYLGYDKKITIGESFIEKFLLKNNILYIPQKKFKNCKLLKVLPFDFYLPDYNTCIEFDGKQHYESNEFFGGDKVFKSIQNRDEIKNNFCKINNIKLIRIIYTEINNIEKILYEKLYNM